MIIIALMFSSTSESKDLFKDVPMLSLFRMSIQSHFKTRNRFSWLLSAISSLLNYSKLKDGIMDARDKVNLSKDIFQNFKPQTNSSRADNEYLHSNGIPSTMAC